MPGCEGRETLFGQAYAAAALSVAGEQCQEARVDYSRGTGSAERFFEKCAARVAAGVMVATDDQLRNKCAALPARQGRPAGPWILAASRSRLPAYITAK